MKNHIEIQGYTKTRAQFLARCRAALRKHPGDYYEAWVDYLNGACEEMDEVANGTKEPHHYRTNSVIDPESPHAEENHTTADSYQIYYKSYEHGAFYNFILEWDDGHGYFYCIDGMAVEQMAATA